MNNKITTSTNITIKITQTTHTNTKNTSNAQATSETSSKVCTHQKRHRAPVKAAPEIGGPKGPEPTRYGDWEKNGRTTDF